MKMANMDAVLNFCFTDPQDREGVSLLCSQLCSTADNFFRVGSRKVVLGLSSLKL